MTPENVPTIPAMTTDAERLFCYRTAKELAGDGVMVELGSWMGASTAYIAAGLRDSGVENKAKVYAYDRWKWDHKAHTEKNGGPLKCSSMYKEFKANLGPLLEWVKPRQGEIGEIVWDGPPVAFLFCDAPKRVNEIAHVMRAFAGALNRGSIIAWQDFAHFPSYQIPACMDRMRHYLKFTEAVTPGTTVAFRVVEPWPASFITPELFDPSGWTAYSINEAWDRWLYVLPEQWHARFKCGQALFLFDIGEQEKAKDLLRSVILSSQADQVLPKWKYLNRTHKSMVRRYPQLFALIEREVGLD